MANKQNKRYKTLFSRKSGIVKETEDIFYRQLMVSDPIDEEKGQTIY